MPLYTYVHNLLNALVQITNKFKLKQNCEACGESTLPFSSDTIYLNRQVAVFWRKRQAGRMIFNSRGTNSSGTFQNFSFFIQLCIKHLCPWIRSYSKE
jgi:hypothetical protein